MVPLVKSCTEWFWPSVLQLLYGCKKCSSLSLMISFMYKRNESRNEKENEARASKMTRLSIEC